MARDQRAKYLMRRGNIWQVRLAIPRELRTLYGGATHLQQTLGTGDLATAAQKKRPYLDAWEREFERKRRQAQGSLAPDIQEAYQYREWLRDAANDDDGGDVLRDHAEDRARQIEQKAGYEAAKRWYDLATKVQQQTLQEAFGEWMDTDKHRTATKMVYRHAFREMLDHMKLGGDALPEHVTRDGAKAYARWLESEARGQRGPLQYGTKLNRLMALSSFWKHLERIEAVPQGVNPWKGLAHLITGKKEPHKDAEAMKHTHSEAQLLSIINGSEVPENYRTLYPKRTLIELYALGSYTGCRLNELCSLTLADVEKTRHGYTIQIRKSKSPAGVRSLPVTHAIPCAVIRRRIGKRKSGQLFEEFKLGGVGKLSANVQKALGRYRDRVGIPPEVDFHSTRRDLITRLEASPGMSPLWIARYAGHTLPGVTFNVYAKVDPASLLKVAQAIRYPRKVEDAYRRELAL